MQGSLSSNRVENLIIAYSNRKNVIVPYDLAYGISNYKITNKPQR